MTFNRVGNRRNFYRILQVQPDASMAVIKSSYRTLMQTLKMHPDLGGDHWNATLINEAYQVLSDPTKRADYDKSLLKSNTQMDTVPLVGKKEGSPFCAFCKTPYQTGMDVSDSTICVECQSPLYIDDFYKMDPQREVVRFKKKDTLICYLHWPTPFVSVEMVDLSPEGIAFMSKIPFSEDQIIKLESSFFQGIASIRHVEKVKKKPFRALYRIGASFISIHFERSEGNFISFNT